MARNHDKVFGLDGGLERRPHNTVFAALMRRVSTSGGSGRHVDVRPRKRDEDKDLADRIREIGEW